MAKNAAAKTFTLGLDADGWYRSAPPQDVDPPSVPTGLAATPGALSVALSWNASTDSHSSIAGYSVYQGTSSSGPWTLVTTIGTTSHNVTGLSASTTYWFTVEATDGAGNTSAKATAVSATTLSPGTYPGTLTTYFATDFEVTNLTDTGVVLWSPTGHDAYDHTVDNPCEVSTVKKYAGSKSLRVQLTQHRFGSNTFPDDNDDPLTVAGDPDWYYKDAGGPGQQYAHRNEFKWPAGTASGPGKASAIEEGEEHWMGFAVYLPDEDDPDDDWEWQPNSWWSYSFGPQLHATNNSQGQGTSPPIAFAHGSFGWQHRRNSLAGVVHPSGAPVVRYQRGGDSYTVGSTSGYLQDSGASKLRVEWDEVAGASTYKVYRSCRAGGPFVEVTTGGNITVDTAQRRYYEEGLGTSGSTTNMTSAFVYVTAVVGGVESAPSLICPAPRNEWGAQIFGTGGSNHWAIGTAERGQWVRFVLRYRLSRTGDGYIQCWKNGVEVVWLNGINIGANFDNGDHYWRMGFYCNVPSTTTAALDPEEPTVSRHRVPADWPARRIIYFDNLTMLHRTGGDHARTDTGDPAYTACDPLTATFE